MSEVAFGLNNGNSEKRFCGKVLKVNQSSGYAFISCVEDGRDYFAHHSQVMRGSIAFRNLKEGMSVTFSPKENPDISKGPIAERVILAG